MVWVRWSTLKERGNLADSPISQPGAGVYLNWTPGSNRSNRLLRREKRGSPGRGADSGAVSASPLATRHVSAGHGRQGSKIPSTEISESPSSLRKNVFFGRHCLKSTHVFAQAVAARRYDGEEGVLGPMLVARMDGRILKREGFANGVYSDALPFAETNEQVYDHDNDPIDAP